VYQETQAVTTSTLGLFNINIGQGTIVTGTLAGVNWGGGAKFLQVEMDPTGGTSYVSMGTTQLNSVPYALFAGSIPSGAGWSQTGNSGTVDGTNFIGTTDNQPLNFRVNNQKAGRLEVGLQNAFYGYQAGNSNTTGTYNTAIGNTSLYTNTAGGFNTATGYGALYNNTGSYNSAFGYYALYSNTTGTGNLANGASALRNNTTGSYNLANGYATLLNNTTGSYNQASGYAALISNTTGNYNSATGYAALYNNTSGTGNFADGAYALNTNTSGSYNLGIGILSLYSNTTGGNNNAIGYGALQSNTSGIQNTANGYQALFFNSTASNHTAVGYKSLYSNTTGSSNTGIGDSALYKNTTGGFNTATGYAALSSNTTGSNNTAIGDSANVATGALNNATALGYNAIASASNTIQLGNTTIDSVMAGTLSANTKLVVPRLKITGGTLGANSVLTSDALGNATWQPSSLSGWSLTGNAGTVDGTNFIGTTDNTPLNFRVNNLRAGRINPSLANTFFGVQSGGLITTGGFNTANGNKALYSTTSGAYNSAHGDSALYSNTTGGFNTANGFAALATNTTGSKNTAIGDSADATTGALTNATAIGYNAKVSASNTIQLGNASIDSVMAGSLADSTKLVVPRLKITGGALAANNILTSDALGNATWKPAAPSGWSLTGNAGTVDGTNFIGTTDNMPFNIRMNNQKAGRIDSTLRTTFYGYQSGGSYTTGAYNTANGYKSLFSNTTGVHNTANGHKSLFLNTTGAYNTANGDSALHSNTTGGFNTAHGYAALASNTTGSNNTALGDSADVTTGALTNATAIGYNAKVSASNTIQLGNAATDSVMAGSTADSTKLIIPRLRVTGGTPAAGQVLTATDVNGNAKWQTLPSGFPTATAPGQMLYWNGTAWVVVPVGTRGQTLTFCEGVPTWGACPAISATVTTTAVSNIFSNKATGGGNVTYNGDAPIITSGVVWSTSAIPATGSPTGTFTTDGVTGSGPYSPYTSVITGLTYHTTYFVRAYATNSVGTAYGTQLSFTTGDTTASLTTTAASPVGSTTATTGGTIANNGGSTITTSGVVYSTSTIPATGAPSGTFTTDGTTSGNWTSNLTGLTAGTPYYARAYATNGIGTSYGNQVTFTTTTTPTVSTTSPTSTTSTTSNPGGNISANGGATVTASGVVYSTSSTPTPSGPTAGLGGGFIVTTDGNTSTWTSSLTGLLGSTTYYAYAYATNSVGTSYGSQVSFTTSAPVAPTLTTTAVSSIAATTASSGGNVTNNGGALVTARGVVWSTSTGATISSQPGGGITTDGTGLGSFSSSLTGLSGSTKYYVRAYATNSAGTTYGTENSFTTTITVGDTYQGGIVFYVTGSPGSQTGLVVSTADQSASIPWYTGTLVATGATGTAIGTGSANTATIVALQNTGNAASTASAYTGGGYNDWYLPSKDALNVLYPLRASFGIGMSGAAYWSSSEVDVNTAWGQAFGFGGSQSATSKNTGAAVRAIRSF
jgi:hypothetical protein